MEFVAGFLQDRVVLSGADVATPGTGTLIFYQRIVLNSNSSAVTSLNAWARSNFTSVTTDVDYATDGLGDLGSSTAQCSTTGSSIQFNLPREVAPGESTYFHMILTNATGYKASGKTTLMGPGLKSVTLTTFQPTGTPQPYYTATSLGDLDDIHINDRGQISAVGYPTSLPEALEPLRAQQHRRNVLHAAPACRVHCGRCRAYQQQRLDGGNRLYPGPTGPVLACLRLEADQVQWNHLHHH